MNTLVETVLRVVLLRALRKYLLKQLDRLRGKVEEKLPDPPNPE